MAGAALHTAMIPASPLREETRAAIRAARKADRALPVEIRRALRASAAAVAQYRDPDAMRLNGIHAVGCMRMTIDRESGELRRLRPGERWSVDDGSVNFGVVVPWPWGGDKCSDRWGVRVGRFQLLPAIDDATSHCTGWGYAIRMRDSYRSEDIVWTLAGIMRNTYKPESIVVEGGSWQANRTLDFLAAAGVPWEDAKGRPHSKLIEVWFNDLWTVLSLESGGQVGRYRGEMAREKDILMECQAGRTDPRRHFPMLTDALNAIQRSVEYKNRKDMHSDIYGSWVPAEAHEAGLQAIPRPALEPGLEYLAARERVDRKVGRFGQVAATADSPLGETIKYHFSAPELVEWHGATVWVHFDPFASTVEATITLAERFRDEVAGKVLVRGAPCLNSAPVISRKNGEWALQFSNGLTAAAQAKRLAQLVVRRELRATSLDGARVVAVSEISAPEAVDVRSGIAPAAAIDFDAIRAAAREETDLAELEQFEAANRVAG
jgi:transposase InsO family protein